jgi:hypothetical protein
LFGKVVEYLPHVAKLEETLKGKLSFGVYPNEWIGEKNPFKKILAYMFL